MHFKVKVFKEDTVYYWYNINMFVNWDGSSGKTVAFIFDPPDDLKPKIPGIILQNLKSQTLMDPFWIYPCVQENIVAIQDREVWGIRTQIRGAELARDQVAYRSLDGKPKPNYARLHDLARHAIHGIETLEVAVKTSQSMIHQHSSFREAFDASPTNQKVAFRAAYHHIQERLLFFEHMLDSLRHRSSSNKQRLLNEVQLAFNSVSQYDAGLSLQISHATRADSSAMRTIAFLTLTFLPATFIAAVFSMSFFSYDHDTGWKMASEFWLYWVIAMPVTVVTAGSWMWWQRYQAEGAKRELFVDTQDVYSRQYSWT